MTTELKQHIDNRFDKLEAKLDEYTGKVIEQEQKITHLQGFAKLTIAIFIAATGFFATNFFHK